MRARLCIRRQPGVHRSVFRYSIEGKIMKTSRRVKIRISAQHIFYLALLLILAWYLAFDPDVKESMGSFVRIVLWIVVVSFIYIVILRWRNQLKAPKIYPFINSTGDKEHKEVYDAFAYNFTDLLQLEVQGINQLIYMPVLVPEQSKAPQPVASITPTSRPTAASATNPMALTGAKGEPPRIHISGAGPHNLVAARTDEQVSDTLKDVGSVELGPVNLPLGGLLSIVERAIRGPGIIGSIQKYEGRLTVVASYENQKWEVSCEAIPSITGPLEQAAIRNLAHQLAIKMVSEVGEHTTANWRSFDELVEGLDKYQRYLQSGRYNQQALMEAQKQFEKSALLDDQFGLAYYYLGLAYEDQNAYESAFEMYKMAVQMDPKLREAYLRLGVMYAVKEQYIDAIEAAKRAIEFAVKAKQPFPEARTSLGNWLILQAENIFQSGNVIDSVAKCREGIRQLRLANNEYKRSVKGARRLKGFSLQQQSNLREKQIEVLRQLSRAYSTLSYYLRQEGDPKIYNMGKANQYSKKAEQILKEGLALNPNNAETHTELAGYYISLGDFTLARDHLEHALGISPEDISIHLDIGNLYLEPASTEITRVVQEFLEDPEKWIDESGTAKIEETYQQFIAAEWYFQNVLDIIRLKTIGTEDFIYETMQAVNGLAIVSGAAALFNVLSDYAFGYTPRYDEYIQSVQHAESLLGKALVISPFDMNVYSGLEGAYQVEAYILERFLGLEQNEQQPELDPEEMQERSALVENTLPAYKNIIDLLDAYQDTPADQAFPGIATITAALALSTEEQRQKEDLLPDPFAEENDLDSLLEGVEEHPETKIYLWTAGWMLSSLEQFGTSQRFLEKAGQSGSIVEGDLVPYDLGNLYFNLKNYDQAIDRYLEVEVADPFFWQSRLALIEIFQEIDKSPKISLSERVVSEGEEPLTTEFVHLMAVQAAFNNPYRRAWALALLADYYYSVKVYDLAVRDCKEAIRLIPGYNYPYIILSFIYMDLKDYDRAIENWERIRELSPHQDMHLYHLGLGDAYFNKGLDTSKPEEKEELIRMAVEQYKEAISLFEPGDAPDEAVTFSVVALALLELKQYKEAELAYRSALELQKGAAEANNLYTQLAYVYVKQKEFSLARQEYLNAITFCEVEIRQAEEDEDTDTIDHYRLGLARARNLLAYYVHAERGVNLEEGQNLVNQALEDLDKTPYPADEVNDLRGAFLDTRGWIYFKLRQFEAAYDDLDQALSLTMGTEYEHAHMALVCDRLARQSKDEEKREIFRLKSREQKILAMDLEKEGVWEAVSKLYLEEVD
jgi:tetratricopeptide (TPR) repeat protein